MVISLSHFHSVVSSVSRFYYSIWFFLVYPTSLHPFHSSNNNRSDVTVAMAAVWWLGWLNWPARLVADFTLQSQRQNRTKLNKNVLHRTYEIRIEHIEMKQINWLYTRIQPNVIDQCRYYNYMDLDPTIGCACSCTHDELSNVNVSKQFHH